MMAWVLAGLAWLLALFTLATLRFAIPSLLIRGLALASMVLAVVLIWRESVDGIEWNDDASLLWMAGVCAQVIAGSLVRQQAARKVVGNGAETGTPPN